MKNTEIENIEIVLLLEAIYKRYGYDFRSYARSSIERRIRNFLSSSGVNSISEMIPRVLHDEEFFSLLARNFSVSVTEMFRDPFVYKSLRKNVIPLLRTWPHFKVWHAGCATGEEMYSMAILLKEESLYNRATIYATDFNEVVVKQAREGIYPIDRLQQATRNYTEAGGTSSFSDYYHARYEAAVIEESLKKRITCSAHNLATDSAFGEMHLIFCRNVLIYFNRELQNRVIRIFTESLVNGGFLCLGTKESLQFTDFAGQYEEVDKKAKIYKKLEIK